jgi:hypothetical protein
MLLRYLKNILVRKILVNRSFDYINHPYSLNGNTAHKINKPTSRSEKVGIFFERKISKFDREALYSSSLMYEMSIKKISIFIHKGMVIFFYTNCLPDADRHVSIKKQTHEKY